MMSEINLKTMLFYVVAALALAEAALAAPTMLPLTGSGSGEEYQTTEATTTADSIATTDGEAQAQASTNSSRSVPVFQCAANTGEAANAESVAELFGGLRYVYYNITEITTKVCPAGYDRSIRVRIHLNPDTTSLHEAVSILQAYSGIALLATQTEGVSESDRRRMLAIHELLNVLIRNYFEVISPNHCSCPGSDTANCINKLRNISQELNLTNFPQSCSPADYVSDTLPTDLKWIQEQFQLSSTFMNAFSSAFFRFISCQEWKGQYIPADSPAYSEFTCDL